MSDKQLDRSLGLFAVIGISIGAMLGSGIFVLPGLAVAKTGSSAWLAYVIAGLTAFPASLSKSELAAAMPQSGGTYIYIDRSFGPFAGTVAGMGLWVALLLKSAFALIGFGAYLNVFATLPLKATAVAVLTLIVGLNIVGVKKVGKAQIFIVMLSLLCLTVLVAMGASNISLEQLVSPNQFTHGVKGLMSTAAFVFVSYAGVTKAAAVAEEVYKPERNLPLGILISLSIMTAIYAMVVLVMTATIPIQELSESGRPVYNLAQHLGGKVFGLLGGILGVMTMTSMANAGILASSRFPFAMSRDHLAPQKLSSISARFKTPAISVIATGAVMAAVILLLDVAKIAKLASAFVIMLFVMENITVIVLRESAVQWYKPKFKSPLYPLTQIFGILSGLGLLAMMGTDALFGVVAVVVPGIVLYFIYGKKKATRKGELVKMSDRKDLASKLPSVPPQATPEKASVLVSLFGNERSPETIVEMGVALSRGDKVVVLDITEIDDSHMETNVLKLDPRQKALQRRFGAMSEAKSNAIEYRALASHDSAKTVHVSSAKHQVNCLLLAWEGRATLGRFFRNPYAWLTSHVKCNLGFFKDAGIRYFRKILVYAEPGPHDVLVVHTADHLAQLFNAQITFVRFVPSEDSNVQFQSQTNYVKELCHMCEAPTSVRMVRGKNLYTAITEESVHHDLLVLGAPPETGIKRLILASKEDNITEQSTCSVLRLRTPKNKMHAEFQKKETVNKKQQNKILDWLVPDCVQTGVKVKNKDELFSFMAKRFAAQIDDVDSQQVERALWERENTQNTSVGRGLALPHATIDASAKTRLGVFVLSNAIDYDTSTDEKLDIFIMTIGPSSERHTHLELLASVAQLVLETEMVTRLRQAESSPDAIETIESSLADLKN